MKVRFLPITLISVLFYLTCNTYEPPVVLEYSIGISVPATSPVIFKNYTFTVHTGDNKFTKLKSIPINPGSSIQL